MKKTYMALGVLALTVITTVGLATASMAASRNNGSVNGKNLGVNQADREAHRAEMEVKRTETQAALTAGDYNAWVKAEGENAPILTKINATNFARFAEAHKLQEQARTIMTELGLENGQGGGMGMGKGMGMGRGVNGGFHQELNK
jgi:hypothetical protein